MIAVILMVAITVVLAAVLYVMVMGIFRGGGENTPVGAFQKPEKLPSLGRVKLRFGTISPQTRPTECKLVIEYTGNNESQNDIAALTSGSFKLDIDTEDVFEVNTPGNSGWWIKYVDMADDKKLSNGDYLEISWHQDGAKKDTWYLAEGEYIVTLLYLGTGDAICSSEFSILA